MGKVVSVHSVRGGTGKSLIAVNLAAILAHKGRNVSIFDFDFRAPSLSTVFRVKDPRLIKYWMNDFLDGRCSIEEVVRDLTREYGTKGRFLVGLANPSLKAIREMATKGRRWEMEALRKLLTLKPVLLDKMGLDYAIYDTSPGILHSSVNAVVGSDLSVVVTTMDALDVEGTQIMLNELYDAFGKKTVVLMNKVFPAVLQWSEEKEEELLRQLKPKFERPIMGMIPCYCDVLQSSRIALFAIEAPDHPFSKTLEEVAEKIERA